MVTVVLGLSCAFVYGSADFLGGLGAKRISPIRIAAVSAISGLALLLLVLTVTGAHWSASAVFWGAVSGVVGAVALSLLYASLAIGPMSILSPLTAVISAIVPLVWGLVGGDRFEPIGYLALGLALIAVVLVGFVPEKGAVRPRLRGIVMGVGAGALLGAFLILIDQTPDDSGLAPLVVNRAVSGAILFVTIAVLAARSRRAATGSATPGGFGWRPGLPFAIAAGLVDATANVLLLLGLRSGDLSVMSVLVALYPAGTIILAAVVLKERVAPVQWVGLVLALAAAGMLAVA